MCEGGRAAGTMAGSRDIPKGHPNSCRCDPGLAGGRGAAEEPRVMVGTWTELFLQEQRCVHPHRVLSRCCSGPGAAFCVCHSHQSPRAGLDVRASPAAGAPGQDGSVGSSPGLLWVLLSLPPPGIPRVKPPPAAWLVQCHPRLFDTTIISLFSELYIFLNAL